MHVTDELIKIRTAVRDSARALGVSCAEEKVQAVLAAFQDALPTASIGFRMGTGQRYAGDVDWRFSVPTGGADPYTVAVEHGLIQPCDHPVSSLFQEVDQRCPVAFYGVDFGAVSGLKKLYLTFHPDDMEPLGSLLGLPSLPTSVTEHYDLFARHGMDGRQMPMFSIDYRHRTVNLYFTRLDPQTLTPDSVRAIYRDMGQPEPSEQLVKLAGQAFSFYATLGWDSPAIERTAFSIRAQDPSDLPVPMDPQIEKFLADMRRQSDDDTFLYYVALSATGEEIYKFQSYYRFNLWLNPVLQSDPGSGRTT